MQINKALRSRELIGSALTWLHAGKQIALVTLINIEGNAPYPVGSQMLVDHDGNCIGHITGGCAEAAIAERAIVAIKRGLNAVERYGLGSPYFDIQLPCGSGIDLVFDVEISAAELGLINDKLNARQTHAQAIALSAYVKVYQPNERLILFGQGPILSCLTSLAIQSGFDVACFVQNQATVDHLNEMGLVAARIFAPQLSDADSDFTDLCDAYSGLVSLFHEHDLETPILSKALQTDVFYLGALGSQQTHANRLSQLRASGVAENLLSKIHGPVGLPIGSTTPAQIAVSILSEVIAVLNKRQSR